MTVCAQQVIGFKAHYGVAALKLGARGNTAQPAISDFASRLMVANRP
jgi:hypothetical protein